MNEKQKQIILEVQDNEEILTDSQFDLINKLADKPEDYTLTNIENLLLSRVGKKLKSRSEGFLDCNEN